MVKLPRTVVITGSTKGIGRAIALRFAEYGDNVVVHGNADHAAAQSTMSAMRRCDGQAHLIMADLSDELGRTDLVQEAWSWRGGVDVWINNAGADVLTGEAASLPFDEKLERLWKVDVLGTVHCSRQIGTLMQQVGQGAIINIGWDQAWVGMEGDSGEMFAAVKGSVMAFSMSLAKSLAPSVRVNCLAPGWIKTSWGEDAASDYWQRRAVEESLRARWGTPADVAEAAFFLASDQADFVNGQVLPVNGGLRTSLGKGASDEA